MVRANFKIVPPFHASQQGSARGAGPKGLLKMSRIKAQRAFRASLATAACSAAALGSSQPHQTASRLETQRVAAVPMKFSAIEVVAAKAGWVAHSTAVPAAKPVALRLA